MKRPPPRNTSASVRQRLLNLSKSSGADYNQLLIRYGIERLLYRLSRSAHRNAFILKGAMLFAVWQGSPHRSTQDLDLLGSGERSLERLTRVFQEMCAKQVEEDGLTFDPQTVTAEEIRTTDEYGGIRVRLTGSLGGAFVRLQVDVGFGDAITPKPAEATYPTLLDLPAPIVRIYPRETVVAEKVEAIARLGMLNTRFKDYYDLFYLSMRFDFEGTELTRALAATFERRGTALSVDTPLGLTLAFGEDRMKQTQWSAFRRRIGDMEEPETLAAVVTAISAFVGPPLRAAAENASFTSRWTPAGPWV